MGSQENQLGFELVNAVLNSGSETNRDFLACVFDPSASQHGSIFIEHGYISVVPDVEHVIVAGALVVENVFRPMVYTASGHYQDTARKTIREALDEITYDITALDLIRRAYPKLTSHSLVM